MLTNNRDYNWLQSQESEDKNVQNTIQVFPK